MVTQVKKQRQHADSQKLSTQGNTTQCSVQYTETFEAWWTQLSEDDQVKVAAVVELLEKLGVTLPYPHSSKVEGCKKFKHLRELRLRSSQGHPYRILYAFDPNRTAILLVGGNKTGDKRWYKKNICIAEQEYQSHLNQLKGTS
ncbi:type II toxin-antitoxin system RelE/ParE family toxin [Baaleninema simplex]|uniref:type II toxin-antitoxin system RelE/ParE family toxin n=1 Tax=Baaleninema simplex TaxID=2862350 RepID=UPI000A0695A4|nr:type II toxin-antitoxin system RelE/ParE family toxin [Baaleninema simplex]